MLRLLPEKAYKTIIKYAPIVSNDILVEVKGRYFFAKRKNEPAKGLWWTPGRRLKKNERIVEAVHQVIKEELGIKKIKIKKFLGVFECFMRPGKFGQKDIHYISFAFLVKPQGKFKIKLDSQHSEYCFFKNPPKDSSAFFKRIFYLAKKKNYQPPLPYTYQLKS